NSATDRGATKRAGEDAAPARRGRSHRGAQLPSRRPGANQEARARQESLRGRGAPGPGTPSEAHRRGHGGDRPTWAAEGTGSSRSMTDSSARRAGEAPESERLPRHVAIIMDGNGRWANERGLPRLHGHRAGTDNVRTVL